MQAELRDKIRSDENDVQLSSEILNRHRVHPRDRQTGDAARLCEPVNDLRRDNVAGNLKGGEGHTRMTKDLQGAMASSVGRVLQLDVSISELYVGLRHEPPPCIERTFVGLRRSPTISSSRPSQASSARRFSAM